MASKVGKRPLRSLSAHEKMEAIRRVHDGESKASVARDIGVPESTLRGWCKNEDKILYLSRQSTPEADDTVAEPRDKKPRYDAPVAAAAAVSAEPQPYNLSVKADEAAAYSPPPQQQQLPAASAPVAAAAVVTATTASTATTLADSAAAAAAAITSAAATGASEPAALNLSKQDSPKGAAAVSSSTAAAAERERNRAELTRLSIELGLNRPEMFLPSSNIAANLSDLSASLTANLGLVAQWNNALLQQVNNNSTNKKQRTVEGPAAATAAVTPHSLPPHRPTKIKKEPRHASSQQQLPPDTSVDDSVWYWLKTQQAMLGLVQTGQNNVDPNSSWFWKWYKQFAYGQQHQQQQHHQQASLLQQTSPHGTHQSPEKPILYQQLTKEANSENLKGEEGNGTPRFAKTSSSSTKARAVLDNLLLNNNNSYNNHNEAEARAVDAADKKESAVRDEATPATPAEALEHGEKFLRWLERCGDPSVTAVQILQFRYLLNNVRTCADRKNGTQEHKTKVRSRK